VAGVALGDICLRFAWQAWHLVTSAFVLRGRRGTCGTGLALVARLGTRLVARGAAPLCVAGVALGDIHLGFASQVWHLVTSAFVLRGRRGACGTGLALVARLGALGRRGAAPLSVAGVALGDICLRFAWQAWHLRHWAGSGGALGRALGGRPGRATLRGRHGTPPWFRVAGVALGDICLRFAMFCVAAVALGALGWLWWPLGRALGRPTLRGRRGTWRHPPSFCVAGVALGDIHLHFAWQVWHLGHWAGSGGAFCVAGMALAALSQTTSCI